MLFKIFIIFQVCLVLCQAQWLKRYQTETIVQLLFQPRIKPPLCKCEGGKCNLDEKAAEAVCKVLKERFLYFGHRNPYFLLCEFDPRTCMEVKQTIPKNYIINVYLDAYYYMTSPIYFGEQPSKRVMFQLFQRNTTFPSPVFEGQPVSIKPTPGVVAMPVEFWGHLNMNSSEAGKYELCDGKSCLETVSEFCTEFTDAMKKSSTELMKYFVGCHIKRIYTVGSGVQMSWSMMFDWSRLMKSGIVKTMWDLDMKIYYAVKGLKPPKLLSCFMVSGVFPLDYCEITATALTTQTYQGEMGDPLSIPYRMNSYEYHKKLLEQLHAGEYTIPSCIRKAVKLSLSDTNGKVSVSMNLWVSMTCSKYRGFKTCEEVVRDIDMVWRRGSHFSFNPWTPEYKFKLSHENPSFDK